MHICIWGSLGGTLLGTPMSSYPQGDILESQNTVATGILNVAIPGKAQIALMLGKIEGRRRSGWQRMRCWMASLTQWVWVSSRSWWWTRKPGMLQSMGSQRLSSWTTTVCKMLAQVTLEIYLLANSGLPDWTGLHVKFSLECKQIQGGSRGQMQWSTGSSATGVSPFSLTQGLGEAGVKFQVELNTWWDEKVTSMSVIPASWDSFTLTCKFPHPPPMRFGYSK